jgi:hypothetical protein
MFILIWSSEGYKIFYCYFHLISSAEVQNLNIHLQLWYTYKHTHTLYAVLTYEDFKLI